MNSKNLISLIVGVTLVAIVIWFMFFNNTWSWHQKLTVVLETPNGEKTGASVTRASVSLHKTIPGQSGGRASNGLGGEAVVIDLEDGKYLFVLLKGLVNLAQYTVLDEAELNLKLVERGELLEQVGRKGVIPRERIPLLVTFEDINDPASVKRVDPDDLDAAFGCASSSLDTPWRDAGLQWRDWQMMRAGGLTLEQYNKFKLNSYRPTTEQAKAMKLLNPVRDTSGDCYSLKSITLEITDEPATMGKVESVLSANFFKKRASIHNEALKRGLQDPYFDSFASRLNRGDFIRKSK